VSDRADLQAQIDRVDEFITTLSPAGETFVRQLRAQTYIAVAGDDFPSVAYFNAQTLTSHFPLDASFAELFNYRVHEGAHAIQALFVPYIIQALAKLETQKGFVEISLPDLVTFTRVCEINANATQAYFNAQAVAKTGDTSYVECFKDDHTLKYLLRRQHALIDQGKSAEEVRDQIAKEFLSLRRSCAADFPYPKFMPKSLLDFVSILTYGKYARQAFNRHNAPQILKDEHIRLVLNAVSPLSPDVSDLLLSQARSPLDLSRTNRFLMGKFGLSL